MIIDKNGKIGGKVSIIDIFVVIILVVAAFGISLRFVTTRAKDARQSVKLSYVIKIEGIRKYTVDALSRQGKVIDTKEKCLIGEITDVSSEEQENSGFDANGKLVYSKVPDRYTSEVTIISEGIETSSGYYVGNSTLLSVGSTISIATKYVNSSGKVIKIEKIE